MATLTEHQANPNNLSLKRGTTDRNLGGKTVVSTQEVKPKLGAVGQFVDKASRVGRQTLDIGLTGVEKAVNLPANFAKTTAKEVGYARDLITNPIQAKTYSDLSASLGRAQENIQSAYASGKMSLEDYKKATDNLTGAFTSLNKENQKLYQGPSPAEKTLGILDAAATVASLGSLGLAEVGAKQALQAGGKEAIAALVNEAATPFEKIALKVPAIRSLVIRNLEQGAKREAQILAGETVDQYIVRNGRKLATDLLIKRPIVYQTNIGQAKTMLNKAAGGDYKGALTEAAWLGSQALEGGPLGAFFKVTGWAKSGIRQLSYGNESLLDAVSRRIGDGSSGQLARFIQTAEKRAPNEFKDIEKNFRVWQEGYLRASNNDVNRAADNVVSYFEQQGVRLEDMSASDIYKSYKNHRAADELWQDLAVNKGLIPGVSKEDAALMTPVRLDQTVRAEIGKAFRSIGPTFQDRNAIYEKLLNSNAAWTNNENFTNKLADIIRTEQTGKDIERAVRAIDAAALTPNLPKKIAKQLSDLGYTIAMPKGGRTRPFLEVDDTRKLVTGAIKGSPEVFDVATAPHPGFSQAAGFLEKAGMSPTAANDVAYRKLSESVVTSLDNLGVGAQLGLRDTQGGDVTRGGQAILSKLQTFIDEQKPNKLGNLLVGGRATGSALTDIRQMTIGEVQKALGSVQNGRFREADKDIAKAVSQAIMDGYAQVPMEFRGMGDKVIDKLYQYNPAQKYYSRVQSALRYAYNPFFRTQERVETKLLSHIQASNLLWMKPQEYQGTARQWLNEGVSTLEKNGIFSSALPGEAAQDQVLGKVTANITQAQKRDLAGLAYDIAKSRGLTLDQLVSLHSDEVNDALRVVVQYPRKGLLASPLARTMNLAFFPMRYNAKVTQIAAQALAKQPATVQKAVLHSIFNMKDWLKSDEGIRWQSQHTDAIQLFNWITPVNSIEYTLNLLGHRPGSMADLGQLGGLPLGIITQLLDGQGILNLNRPYVNPATGDVFPRYIPNTTKARAATALADLLNTMFTYPGRILGLPGKSQAIRGAVNSVVSTKKSEFDVQPQDQNLTPLQENWVRVIKGDTSKEAIDALYTSPAPGQFNWYTLPPLDVRTPATPTAAITRRTGLPSKAKKGRSARTKKTAQAISNSL